MYQKRVCYGMFHLELGRIDILFNLYKTCLIK